MRCMKKLNDKIIKKRKKYNRRIKNEKKGGNSTELQKPNFNANIYNNIKSLTEYAHIHIHP